MKQNKTVQDVTMQFYDKHMVKQFEKKSPYDIVHKIVAIEMNKRARWIDDEVAKLIPNWLVFSVLKFPFLRKITGIEIITYRLNEDCGGDEIVIKKFGEVKARRKFKL